MSFVKLFYDFFLKTNIEKDILFQKELVVAAKEYKKSLLDLSYTLDKKYFWLKEKLEKNVQDKFRGMLIEKNVLEILEEILDPNNSSSKLHWGKSPRKSGIEKIQVEFWKKYLDIDLKIGKKNGITASGQDSYRFSLDGEFLKGVKKDKTKNTKSIDAVFSDNYYVILKVTTDDGGSTNSVEEEIITLIKSCSKFLEKNPNDLKKFVFVLDGPYWLRKDNMNKSKTRFDILYENSQNRLIVCTSDTIKSELTKRELI